jgi:hypothetical protein
VVKPYVEAFPVGTKVAVAPIADLEEFRRTWRLFSPLTETQLQFASKVARVKSVGFYHGGDPLYVLEGVPGVWHEVCLRKTKEASRYWFAAKRYGWGCGLTTNVARVGGLYRLVRGRFRWHRRNRVARVPRAASDFRCGNGWSASGDLLLEGRTTALALGRLTLVDLPFPETQKMPIKRTCPKGHQFVKSTACPACPKCEAARGPEDGLLSLLSAPARRAFERARIADCKDLSCFSQTEVLGLHGVGPSTLPILQKQLSAVGLTFRKAAANRPGNVAPGKKVRPTS